jgi:hypothetical protein
VLIFTIFLFSVFAEDSLCLELVHELDSPEVFLLEHELMVMTNNLKLIWNLMCAYFVNLEKIYFLRLLVDMESPDSIQLSSKAVDRLISTDL